MVGPGLARAFGMSAARGQGRRVVTAGMKGVTAQQAPEAEPATPNRAVAFDACRGVARAGRVEATDAPEQR
jgi:hypothetical protein